MRHKLLGLLQVTELPYISLTEVTGVSGPPVWLLQTDADTEKIDNYYGAVEAFERAVSTALDTHKYWSSRNRDD